MTFPKMSVFFYLLIFGLLIGVLMDHSKTVTMTFVVLGMPGRDKLPPWTAS